MAVALSKSQGLQKDNIPDATDQENEVFVDKSLKENNVSGELCFQTINRTIC